MDCVLENWLIERLGPNYMPKSQHFCTAMADGTLLAQILHSYGILDSKQKNTIHVSDDPERRLSNLNRLVTYLNCIGINVDELTLKKITRENENAAVHLLYHLYTNLEPNNTLHLEIQQKEKETSGVYPPRFTVTKVSETTARAKALEPLNPLAAALQAKSNVIAWHKAKYEQILNTFKENRKRLAERTGEVNLCEGKEFAEPSVNVERLQIEEARKDMQKLTQKYEDEQETDLSFSQLMAEQARGECLSRNTQLHFESVKEYAPLLRRKRKTADIHRKIRESIEKVLLSEAWDKLTKLQEADFDLLVTKKLLKQSQYEKQILSKLHDIRDEKMRIIKNRQFMQSLVFKESEAETAREWMMEVSSASEIFRRKEQDKLRDLEFQRKLSEVKLRLKQEKRNRMCVDALSDMIDIAIKSSDFVTINDCPIPKTMWDELKVLFIKSQPIFDILDNIEQILEPDSDETPENKIELETRRQEVLNEADFDSYMELKGPWLLEELCPELGALLESQTVLGYIVHRLLDAKYPVPSPAIAELPPTIVAVALIGLDDEELLAMLQSLLHTQQVQILQLSSIIEYFLGAYKQELPMVNDVNVNLMATEKTTAEIVEKTFETSEQKENVSGENRPVTNSSVHSPRTDVNNIEENGKKVKKGKKKIQAAKEGVKETIKIQLEDKETQTSEEIETIKEFTPKASLGKLAFETLTTGQKISDDLLVKMLIEYIKENGLQKWVLVNYPQSYLQAKIMEEAFVGITLPAEEEVEETLEDLEEVKTREVEEKQSYLRKRVSKLVPNINVLNPSCDGPKSCLTAYIIVEKRKPVENNVEKFNQEHSTASKLFQIGKLVSEKQSQNSKTTYAFNGGNLSKNNNQTDFRSSKATAETTKSNYLRGTGERIQSAKGIDQKKESVKWQDTLHTKYQTETENKPDEDRDQKTKDETYELNSEVKEINGLTPLEKFYFDQCISFKFYYDDFDLQTLKNLARLIIGDISDSRRPSIELFGPVLEELKEYLTEKSDINTVPWNAMKILPPKKLAKSEVAKEEKPEKSLIFEDEKNSSIESNTQKDGNIKKDKKQKKTKKEKVKKKENKKDFEENSDAGSERSGESFLAAVEREEQVTSQPKQEELLYMQFEIAQPLLVTLASLWENLEEIYIKDFKEAFFVKRIYDATVIPYASYVKDNVLKLIDGPDIKQILVHDFQMLFNVIEEDLRSDEDMKCELHARVRELQLALYDISDSHKDQVESERKRIIQTNWVTVHLAALTNLFLLFIQLEADRFVDTLQLLQDYYTAMLGKLPMEYRLKKVMITRMELAMPVISPPESEVEDNLEELNKLSKQSSIDDTSIIVCETSSKSQTMEVREKGVKSVSLQSRRESGFNADVKSITSTEHELSDMKFEKKTNKIEENQSEKCIENISTSQQPCPSGTKARDFVENFLIDIKEPTSTSTSPFHSVIQDVVESVSSVMDDYTQKQRNTIAVEESALNEKNAKGKKWKDRDTSAEEELKKSRMRDLRAVGDRFFQEWRTVLNSEDVRAKARLQLILKRASQDLDDLLQWAKSLFNGLHEEMAERYKAEIAAVDALCKVFCNAIEDEQRIQEELVLEGDKFFIHPEVLMFPRAPPKEPLPVEEPFLDNSFRVEQLKHLLDIFRTVAPTGLMPERALCYILEDLIVCRSESHELPPLWYKLTSSEVPALIEIIYGKVEFVEWRELIIRALDITFPSMRQLLQMCEEFRKYDHGLHGTISVESYNQITLWFEKNIPEDEVTRLRTHLTKEMLFDMFQVCDKEMPYMTFLLSFCKDTNPKRGLAKALALGLGKPLITTEREYKEYLKQVQEEERKFQEQYDEACSAAQSVIWEVIDDAVQTSSGIILKELEEITTKINANAVEIEEQQYAKDEEYSDVTKSLENEKEIKEQEKEKQVSDDKTEVLFRKVMSSSSTSEEELNSLHKVAATIPAEVLVNVLTTSLPWHGKTENVLDAGEQSLLVKVDHILAELGSQDNCIIAHELFSHSFISDLLKTSFKFHDFHLEEKVNLLFQIRSYFDYIHDQARELAE